MPILLALVIWALVIALAIYRELPLWSGSGVAAVSWWLLGYASPALHHPLLWLPLLTVLLVLNIPALRRPLISAKLKRQLATLLPPMSITEREALEAGTAWWDKELFSGKPDWSWYAETELPQLTVREQAFLDNEVETLCEMLDEWQIQHELKDLPPAVWQFLKDKGFFGFIIPPAYGGLGFSAYAQSCVMTKLATRSITAAVSAMVPNSLGPGELLLQYGTDAQKQRWLPGLASGAEIPCFGLTGPEAGSDAGSIPDRGVVCYGEYEGQTVLGIRLTFAKRWITLAPIATVVGLAFKLSDPELLLGNSPSANSFPENASLENTSPEKIVPENIALKNIAPENVAPESIAPENSALKKPGRVEYGITCVLIPATHPGVEIGLRHNPSAPFMNGPVRGTDIFIPIDWIIGGPAMAGKGWRMLMHCLGAGRGISLPAVATAGSKVCYRAVGAFARIREQFHTPVGRFEGVQEATAEIAAIAYTLEAMRQWVSRSLGEGSPAVVTAIAKYHSTEMMRTAVDHAMDVLGGRGIQLGPRNPIGLVYQGVPLGITVEGANIMTRSLMIFGQGAMRCHPYLFEEFQLLAEPDSPAVLARFDNILFRHIGFTTNRLLRMIVLGWFGRWIDSGPRATPAFARPWYQTIDRFSAILAVTADVGLLIMGGKLKMRELLSARLGDVLSQLFIASSILKYHASLPADSNNDLHADYALRIAFVKAQRALLGFYENFPVRWIAWVLKHLAFPMRMPVQHASDQMVRELGNALMEPSEVRTALSECCYQSGDEHDALGRLEMTFQLLLEIEAPLHALRKAQRNGEIGGTTFAEQLSAAVAQGIVAAADQHKLSEYERLRYECLLTDVFDKELKELRGAA